MKPNIVPPPDSGNPASDTADTWIDQLHSRPQSASEFAFWLGDQLGEDLEAWEPVRQTPHVVRMSRNGVPFRVTVEVESEE